MKFEPIGAYLQSDRCVKAKIVRVPCKAYIAQKAVEYALSKIGFPFDNDSIWQIQLNFIVPNWYGELIFLLE